jgi:hypothetical protein
MISLRQRLWIRLGVPCPAFSTNVCLLWVTTGYMPVQKLPSHTLPNFSFLLKSYWIKEKACSVRSPLRPLEVFVQTNWNLFWRYRDVWKHVLYAWLTRVSWTSKTCASCLVKAVCYSENHSVFETFYDWNNESIFLPSCSSVFQTASLFWTIPSNCTFIF